MDISDFDYDLPEERIAQTPLEPRDSARLMVLHPKEHTIEHRHFYELGDFLRNGDVLIFNDTRVIPARLIGAREGRGLSPAPNRQRPMGSACQTGEKSACWFCHSVW